MGTFVNTVDKLGDVVLSKSIVDRSITEVADDVSAKIRHSAFKSCTALATVNFPNVTGVYTSAFEGCTGLTKADFGSYISFDSSIFANCNALISLILRSDTLCKFGVAMLKSTPIASGTGYIYVPAALVDSYKTASGWSTYADQIRAIEDYPEVCDPYT